MKTKVLLVLLTILCLTSCNKNASYTPEFIKEASGRYLFNSDEVIEVYFENDKLFLKWRGAEKIEPMYLKLNTYFIKEMNKKITFEVHPETKIFYISEVLESDTKTTYDYKKLPDSVNVPSAYLKNKEYTKALAGYAAIQKEDSTSVFVSERIFNRFGYDQLREKNYDDAIEIFKINVALYPGSANTYDSLAEAYLQSGDSVQALAFYKKTLSMDSGNRGAKRFVDAYNKKE